MAALFNILLIFSLLTFKTQARLCEESFVRLGEMCYWFSPQNIPVPWFTAKEICERMDSNLLHIESKEEENLLASHIERYLLGRVFWIAATDVLIEGEYVLILNKTVVPMGNYSDWGVDEPSDLPGAYCAVADYYNRLEWKRQDCTKLSQIICQQK